MKPFAVKTLLGFALSNDDLQKLKHGESVVGNLSSCDVGLWIEENGKRTFIQPRESVVVFIAGDSVEEIGEFLHANRKT